MLAVFVDPRSSSRSVEGSSDSSVSLCSSNTTLSSSFVHCEEQLKAPSFCNRQVEQVRHIATGSAFEATVFSKHLSRWAHEFSRWPECEETPWPSMHDFSRQDSYCAARDGSNDAVQLELSGQVQIPVRHSAVCPLASAQSAANAEEFKSLRAVEILRLNGGGNEGKEQDRFHCCRCWRIEN